MILRPTYRSLRCGAIVLSWSAAMLAAEPATEAKSAVGARLGFRYDPKIREAAVAEKRSLNLTPPDEGVVRLPKYEVTEDRFPLEDRELLTPQGRVAVATKRYLSPMYQKTLGPLAAVAALVNNPLGGWRPNSAEALALLDDEENKYRRMRIDELSELARFAEEAERQRSQKPAKETRAKP